MKRIFKVYKKTVSIVNETSTALYENLTGMTGDREQDAKKKGFLLESYDKNYDRFTFMGAEPAEIITSDGEARLIARVSGGNERREGKPLE